MKRRPFHTFVRWVVIVLSGAAAAALLALLAADLADRRFRAHLAEAPMEELRALARQSDHDREPMVFYWLGVRLSDANRHREAVEALARAAMLDPRSPRIRYALGVALDRMGRPQEAADQLKQAIALAPDAAQPHFVLGKLYGKYGRWPEARQYLQRAADLNPKDIEAPFLLSVVYQQLAKTTHEPWREQERALLEALAKRVPTDARILRALAACYVYFNQIPQAEATYRRILALDPADLKTRALLGRAVADRADAPDAFAEAEELLTGCLHKAPDDSGVRMALGVLYFRQGASEKALPHFERAVRLNVSEPEAWFYLGRVYASLGRAAQARQATATFTRKDRLRREIRSLEMRLGFSEETPAQARQQDTLRLQLARALMEDGRFRPALDHLRYFLLRNGGHPEALRLARRCVQRLAQRLPAPQDARQALGQ